MPRLPLACAIACTTALGAVTSLTTGAAGTAATQRPPLVQPHAAFDQTTNPAPAHWQRGAPAAPLIHPKIPLLRGTTAGGLAPAGAAPDPEVLGFAQVGEVTSGAWTRDLHLNLLSTVAYFGLNVNGDGTLVTNDTGWAGWWSSQLTSLMNAAHNAGDRVVLTVKSFSNTTIASVTGSETARRRLISQIIGQLQSRGGDGVNIDFEGTSSSVRANFTIFIAELYGALRSQAPQRSYLTIDTYAAAGLGGTMYDLSALTPHLDAFDLMGYGFESGSTTSPTAPLHGDWYDVTRSVSDYMNVYGVPAYKLILGVPYYGGKWNVSNPVPGNDGEQPGSHVMADIYSDTAHELTCAQQLRQFWDATFDEPYITWYSPRSGDPCDGNWGSYREVYYDNAQSLGDKYDLVNAERLRGIGIWALGYDSGSNNLWNEIALKFSVTHGPAATVAPLPATQTTTAFTVSWSLIPGSPQAAWYVVWVQPDGGHWLEYEATRSTSMTAYGFPGHRYGFYVQAVGVHGNSSGGPASAQASTTVDPSATWSETPFHTMYAVSGSGALLPGASPPVATPTWPGWDIARGVALDGSGNGGVTLDGWGGLHPFGDATSAGGGGYWPGWNITRGIAVNDGNQGYVLDGWGGIHPFSMNGAAQPPRAQGGAYWPGHDIARGIALFGDGSGGVVLDGWGGVHPFSMVGSTTAAPVTAGAYWPGWDIARGVVLKPGSTAQHYGGYVLDGWGGIHPFGSAGSVPAPITGATAYWRGWDIARGIVLLPGSASAGYVLEGWGGMHAFGGAPGVASPGYSPGHDLGRGIAIH